MPISRREQAEASRAHLVDCARACFAEEGYEGTSVAAILERAGMARGALYHYFPGGKLDLFHAVFESVNDAFHVSRDAVLALPSPIERIRAGARVFLDRCLDSEFAQVALLDAPGLLPGQAGRGSTFRLLEAQVEQASEVGELGSLDPAATAAFLYGAIRGAGEFVAGASDGPAAVEEALRALDRWLAPESGKNP